MVINLSSTLTGSCIVNVRRANVSCNTFFAAYGGGVTDPGITARLRAAGCVFADEEAGLLVARAGGDPEVVEEGVARRIAGEPLEYILGWVEFDGSRVGIEPGVFIPRRRTGLLVDVVAGHVAGSRQGRTPVVVDLACGSGAIGLAVARRVPGIELHATDVDEAAVACAARNLANVGGRAHLGDMYDPLPGDLRGRVDAIAANMPYVPRDRLDYMPAESRRFEPVWTVDGGRDGLDLVRAAAAGAGRWLGPGGILVVETGDERTGQPREVVAAFEAAGLVADVRRDEEMEATAVVVRS
jgi:release factor glutamine methyltransferase